MVSAYLDRTGGGPSVKLGYSESGSGITRPPDPHRSDVRLKPLECPSYSPIRCNESGGDELVQMDAGYGAQETTIVGGNGFAQSFGPPFDKPSHL